MPGPFPGMDPWLEAPGLFPDLHQTLIGEIRNAIAAQLPEPYYTGLATRLYIEESQRYVEPDINMLVGGRRPKRSPAGGTAVLDVTPPLKVRIKSDPIREGRVEIRHGGTGDRLVTSIEILSPVNKLKGSVGRRQYLRKRREMRLARVNIVEIDFLRAGVWTTLAPLDRVERSVGRCSYHVSVNRSYRSGALEIYPIFMGERLPKIAVPLLKVDGDIAVDLHPPFDRSYDVARFHRRAGYGRPATPPLGAEQQAWAEELIRSHSAK